MAGTRRLERKQEKEGVIEKVQKVTRSRNKTKREKIKSYLQRAWFAWKKII